MFLTDPIAQGIHDYHFKRKNTPIIIHSEGFDPDEVLPSYFFRSYPEMPFLEQKALQMVKGTILDVGACGGCHSYYLQNKGFEVHALERSPLSCQVLTDRKIKNVICTDFYLYNDKIVDTILLLMNGTGIAGKLRELDNFLKKLKSLLAPNGQILIDSTDLIYLYMDDDGSAEINLNADQYYGELTYQTEYNGQLGLVFPWLYVDKETLSERSLKNGLKIDQIIDGEHYDYLAVIKHK